EKFRIRVAVSVAYGSDIDQVRRILTEVATGEEMVCEVPEPRVRFRTFGDSGLNFELLCWVDKPVLRGRVLDALNSEVYKRFQSEGVEIPYPKRDVYIKSQPGKSS
ncbi:MAG: mechanosensitive ion channel family protein, partial [Gammaproteobacteria bacterium]